MSKFRNLLLGVAAVTSLGALTGVAFAQTLQSAAPPHAAAPQGDAAQMHDGRRDPAQRGDRLRQMLKLTANQEPALQTWLAATAPKSRDHKGERAKVQAMTTPQRLDYQLANAAKREAGLKTRADATKRFYATLTSEQKAVFDAMPMMRGRGDKGHGGHGRMSRRDHHKGHGMSGDRSRRHP